MSDNAHSDDVPNIDHETSPNRWMSDPVLETDLPHDVQSGLGRFLGIEAVETLDEWANKVRRHVGGESISLEDLCRTEETTPHRGTLDGEQYHFACFYDAVILAALSDRPVDVRTESPAGRVVRARAVGTEELTVTPDGAVFSFGIEASVDPPADSVPTFERGYGAICPYIRAFSDRDGYERWRRDISAPTVAMPLSGATELAAELVE